MAAYYTPPGPAIPQSALAVVAGSPAYPAIRGTVRMAQTAGGVIVTAEINGLPPTPYGFFAFHLHEGTCAQPPVPAWYSPAIAAETPPEAIDWFAEAGAHFNPGGQPHPRHAGDFPNLLETQGGYAQLSFLTDRFTLAQTIGRAVIIHLYPNDYRSQPAGNAGLKIACGVMMPERGAGPY